MASANNSQMAAEAHAGNFCMGQCFADIRCMYGHRTRLFNIGRDHYVACDECRAYIWFGSNLMSGWRQENLDVWDANWESIRGYREVE